MLSTLRNWIRKRRLENFGIVDVRHDILLLAQDVHHRCNIIDAQLRLANERLENVEMSVVAIGSLFGHVDNSDEPLTKQDLDTRSPWDRT